MNEERKQMDLALKEVFIPELRERGFKGSSPHFHRFGVERVDYLMVQSYSAGGSIVVEIAKSGPNGIEEGYGSELPINKLNVTYTGNRMRLGSEPENWMPDHWFEFGRKSYDDPEQAQPYEHYIRVANTIVSYVSNQAEAWWSDF